MILAILQHTMPKGKKIRGCVNMSVHGTTSQKKKYGERVSPPYPANECCGQVIEVDGVKWVSEKRGKSNACRWYRVKTEAAPSKNKKAPAKTAAARGRASTKAPSGVKRARSRSSSRDGYGTKATLANALTCEEIRAAFVRYQKADAAWATKGECERKKSALVRKAKRDTLVAAYVEKTAAPPAAPSLPPSVKRAKKDAKVNVYVRKGQLKGAHGLRKTRKCANLPSEDLCERNDYCYWDTGAKARGERGCRTHSEIKSQAKKDIRALLKKHKHLYAVFPLNENDESDIKKVRDATEKAKVHFQRVYRIQDSGDHPSLAVILQHPGSVLVAYEGDEDHIISLYELFGADKESVLIFEVLEEDL